MNRLWWGALLLCGCSAGGGGGGYPSTMQMEAYKCRGSIHRLGEQLEASKGPTGYPDKLPPEVLFRCPLTRKNTLAYEVGADHQHFRIFCRGDNHVRGGLPMNYPCYTSGKGVESQPHEAMQLPPGFPVEIAYQKLIRVEADREGAMQVEAEVADVEVSLRELNGKFGDPLQHRGLYGWRVTHPKADNLGVSLDTRTRRVMVSYHPSHLSD